MCALGERRFVPILPLSDDFVAVSFTIFASLTAEQRAQQMKSALAALGARVRVRHKSQPEI